MTTSTTDTSWLGSLIDAVIGQDAVKTAAAFHQRLTLSGIVMTKLDGDARGGAALSIREVTGAPLKFVGTGEGLDKLKEFRPEGMASRILGFGDIVGLMKDFEGVLDEKKAEKDAARMLKGQFTLQDFLEHDRHVPGGGVGLVHWAPLRRLGGRCWHGWWEVVERRGDLRDALLLPPGPHPGRVRRGGSRVGVRHGWRPDGSSGHMSPGITSSDWSAKACSVLAR